MPCAASGLLQIDTAQQQQQLLVAEDDLHLCFIPFWPAEAPFLQTLVTQSEMQVLRSQQRALSASHIRFIHLAASSWLAWASDTTDMEDVSYWKSMM